MVSSPTRRRMGSTTRRSWARRLARRRGRAARAALVFGTEVVLLLVASRGTALRAGTSLSLGAVVARHGARTLSTAHDARSARARRVVTLAACVPPCPARRDRLGGHVGATLEQVPGS